MGQRRVHPSFKWIWRSRCQMKHKVFFWLLLIDRLPTRDILGRKCMNLDSFVFELCILQKRETVNHLFFRCNVGVTYISTRSHRNIIEQIKRKLGVPFYMEIIILMSWRIWTTRNNWLFKLDPSITICK